MEFFGWICPLTPLENRLRQAGGAAGYEVGFVERYILPVLYPADVTRQLQVSLGVIVCAVNLVVYALVWHRRSRAGVR